MHECRCIMRLFTVLKSWFPAALHRLWWCASRLLTFPQRGILGMGHVIDPPARSLFYWTVGPLGLVLFWSVYLYACVLSCNCCSMDWWLLSYFVRTPPSHRLWNGRKEQHFSMAFTLYVFHTANTLSGNRLTQRWPSHLWPKNQVIPERSHWCLSEL